MLACDFPQRNAVLGKPRDLTDEQCYGLPCHRYIDSNGRGQIISCWRPSREDLQEFTRTGQIWVTTMGFKAVAALPLSAENITLTPFCLMAENPFEPCETLMFDPLEGSSVHAKCEAALDMSDRAGKPVDFSFNGVRIRVYPGKKVPVHVYEEYYKAVCQVQHMVDVISAANAQ
jgi:hypothetical protein